MTKEITSVNKARILGMRGKQLAAVEKAYQVMPSLTSRKFSSIDAYVAAGSRKHTPMISCLSPIINFLLRLPKFVGGVCDPKGVLSAVMKKLGHNGNKRLVPCQRLSAPHTHVLTHANNPTPIYTQSIRLPRSQEWIPPYSS